MERPGSSTVWICILSKAVDKGDRLAAKRYATSALAPYHHVYMLEVARRVPIAEQSEFERTMRSGQLQDFKVSSFHHEKERQKALAAKDETWPIVFLHPEIPAVHEIYGASLLPRCPSCGNVARPNILMFNDTNWIPDRTEWQFMRYRQWLENVQHPVVIEIRAGTAIPTVRHAGNRVTKRLIRINPAEERSSQAIHIQTGALEGLKILQDLS